MDTPDISTLSNSLIGLFVPWIVQFVRHHWLPWSGKTAMWLSFAISTVCVLAAYCQTAQPPTVEGAISNAGIAYALSQVVFTHVEDALKGALPTGGNGA